MPYASLSQLPPEVKRIPEHGQRIFMKAFNSAFMKYKAEEKAFRIAWSAVKQVFKKTSTGWEKRKSFDKSVVYSSSFEHYKSETNENDFFVEGYIETPDMDILGDVCTVECLDDIDAQLNDAFVMAKVGREHEHSLIDRNILHVSKVVHHERDDNGVFVRTKLNKFHPDFETVKGSIEEGYYDAFSIEYFPEQWTEDVITSDGEFIPRKIDKLLLTGITYTGKPVNHGAVITNFGEGLIKSMAIKDVEEEMKAVWSAAYKSSLPDSSFAYVGEDGKRSLPYKDKKGKIDVPHLRNALARLDQTDISADAKVEAKKKLLTAARKLGIGEKKKSLDQEETDMTKEEIKEEVKEETPSEKTTAKETEKAPETQTPAEKTESKEEVKSEEVKSEETKSETEDSEEVKALKEEVKALKETMTEEIKSAVIEELKSIKPETNNLVDTKEEKFTKEEVKSDVVSQVTRQLGLKHGE